MHTVNIILRFYFWRGNQASANSTNPTRISTAVNSSAEHNLGAGEVTRSFEVVGGLCNGGQYGSNQSFAIRESEKEDLDFSKGDTDLNCLGRSWAAIAMHRQVLRASSLNCLVTLFGPMTSKAERAYRVGSS